MAVVVRTLFPPTICETGYREAIELMIATLMEVILSLKDEQSPLDRSIRHAAIEDAERQIAELEAYREGVGAEEQQPPRDLEGG
jgi:hypothetical protein